MNASKNEHALFSKRLRGWLICSVALMLGLNAARAEDANRGMVVIHSIDGFADAVRDGNIPCMAIPSAIACECVADGEARDHQQKAREWGRAMLEHLETVPLRDGEGPVERVQDALAFRTWCLGRTGYGNLILSYAAEEYAVSALLEALADSSCDTRIAECFAEECASGTASLEYWMSMLESEGKPIRQEDLPDSGEAEGVRLAALFQRLWDDKVASDGHESFPHSGNGYEKCYDGFEPALAGWLAMRLSIRKVSMAACLAVKKATGEVPREQMDFIQAVRQHADEILKRKDRLGGRVYGDQVWLVWREVLEKAN